MHKGMIGFPSGIMAKLHVHQRSHCSTLVMCQLGINLGKMSTGKISTCMKKLVHVHNSMISSASWNSMSECIVLHEAK